MKAVIFAEISNLEKMQGHTIEDKLFKLRGYCEYNKFTVIKEFTAISYYEATLIMQDFTTKRCIETPHTTKKLHECLDFIAREREKIFLVTYDGGTYDAGTLEHDIIKTYFPQYPQDKSEIETRKVGHSVFIEPVLSQKIWRYISLTKFLDMLQNKRLFFTRMDKMRQFDQMEGKTLTKRQEIDVLDAIQRARKDNIKIDVNSRPAFAWFLHHCNESYHLREHFVNCWHMNNNESFAMWKVYSDNFGVCIQSTYKRLRASFRDAIRGLYKRHMNESIFIGIMRYIDYSKDNKNYGNSFYDLLYKRIEFKYENELRCVVCAGEYVKDDNGSVIDVISPESLTIEIDLNELVERVYISPFAPNYFFDTIKNLCKKYEVSADVIKSDI